MSFGMVFASLGSISQPTFGGCDDEIKEKGGKSQTCKEGRHRKKTQSCQCQAGQKSGQRKKDYWNKESFS